MSVSAPIRYKVPDFDPLIKRLQEIRSHLILDYDRIERLLPNALTGNEKLKGFSEDARLTGIAHLIRLVDCTLLSFTLMNDNLLPPGNKWWDAVRTQPLDSFNNSHRSMTVNTFNNAFIKFGFLHKLFSTIENTSRLILRALDPTASNNATSSIYSVWQELFPRLTAQAPNSADLLTLLRLTRNTIHNNGVYVSKQQQDEHVTYEGTIYDFTHMKPINFVNWTFLIERLDDVRELLVSIVSDATVIGIPNPILDPFATNRTVLPSP
jgi:hypothetical protein